MDAEKLWKQLQEICSLDAGEDTPYSFEGIVAVSFSETAKLLTLQAKDTSQAIYLNTRFGDTLIKALESLVGSPAFIECTYNPQAPKANPRFTVRRTDDDYIIDVTDKNGQKSAMEMLLEDISDLKRRVAELEAKAD